MSYRPVNVTIDVPQFIWDEGLRGLRFCKWGCGALVVLDDCTMNPLSHDCRQSPNISQNSTIESGDGAAKGK